MENFSKENFIFNIVVGSVPLVLAFLAKNIYQKICKNKKGYLLYDIKKYEIGEGDVIEIICLWNPTNHEIKRVEITKNYEFSICNDTSLTAIKTTNQMVSGSVYNDNNKKLRLDFETFPSNSGCIYTIKSKSVKFRSLLRSGEINNKIIESYGDDFLNRVGSIAGNFVLIMLIFVFTFSSAYWILGANEGSKLMLSSSSKLSAYIIFFLLSASSFIKVFSNCFVIFSQKNKKPKVLLDTFNGK